jgi:aminoglycoside/choline kinase family phosphotransferase
MNSAAWRRAVGDLLGRTGPDWEQATCTEVSPDGSSRRFCRIRTQEGSWLAVLPPADEAARAQGLAEARSFALIGRHLHRRGAPVPALYGYDPTSGLVVCEDLGTRHLFDLVRESGAEAALPMYEQAMRALARMQVRGADGFDPGWCWESGRYDETLMRERESGYFLRACCIDLLGLEVEHPAVEADCIRLA